MTEKTWSIVEIVDDLRRGGVRTSQEIAADYGVTLRTAQRWMAECALMGEAESFDDETAPTHRLLWRKAR